MVNKASQPSGATGSNTQGRSAARLAAVQALYQMDLAQTDLNDVIAEFMAHRIGSADVAPELEAADQQYFSHLLHGVMHDQRKIDPLIDAQLATGWRLVRIDKTLRAILRAGTFELIEQHDVPVAVVVNEYIDVAHAFFDGDEPKVVNGVLDALAQKVRPGDDDAGDN